MSILKARARAVGSTLAVLAALVCTAAMAVPPGDRTTRPEASGFTETSRYDDVIASMQASARASAAAAANAAPANGAPANAKPANAAPAPSIIHLTHFGYSFEGRALPLAVIGAPNATAEAVLATGKTRVLVLANIHAGEVEGKEACLMLLRDIAEGKHHAWLESMVVLVAPIYNADGNERINVANRGAQDGPLGGMGQRHNAQDLDLNRDATKLETAEARSLARLLNDYDPHVAIDMHTTDGSDHGYYLTYDQPGSPNTSKGIATLLRDQLLPSVTRSFKAKHGWNIFYYGGPVNEPERAWSGDAELYRPRYTHTYFGIRNRLGILSEAYSYATFEDRIKASLWFVEEILEYVASNGAAIRKATADADAESIIGTEQAVRGKLAKAPELVDIVLADTEKVRNPYLPDQPIRKRVNGSERIERMPHYGLIVPSETSTAPSAYVVLPSAALPSVEDRLQAHGISYFKTQADRAFTGERFAIATSKQDARAYTGGGHKLRTLTGAWAPVDTTIPAGALVVPMNQPLARLAFVLLDARSDDGFMAWGVLDRELAATPAPDHYPVLRTQSVEWLKE